jgi:hypothetical protein
MCRGLRKGNDEPVIGDFFDIPNKLSFFVNSSSLIAKNYSANFGSEKNETRMAEENIPSS